MAEPTHREKAVTVGTATTTMMMVLISPLSVSYTHLAEDAPIFKVFNIYQIVSSQDMWTFLYESLTDIQLERFRACIISVFGTEDPTFELPEEHWAMASIYGKETKYSMLLREGLIISLILLSEQEMCIRDRVLRQLLRLQGRAA